MITLGNAIRVNGDCTCSYAIKHDDGTTLEDLLKFAAKQTVHKHATITVVGTTVTKQIAVYDILPGRWKVVKLNEAYVGKWSLQSIVTRITANNMYGDFDYRVTIDINVYQ